MKKVAGTLKLIYSQYRELQSFAQFGSDLDADIKARLAQGERIVEVLKQNRSAPVAVEKQVAILHATIHDYLANIKVPAVYGMHTDQHSFHRFKIGRIQYCTGHSHRVETVACRERIEEILQGIPLIIIRCV